MNLHFSRQRIHSSLQMQMPICGKNNEGDPQVVRSSGTTQTNSLVSSFITFKLQNQSRSVLSFLLQQLYMIVFPYKIIYSIAKGLTKTGESILKGP